MDKFFPKHNISTFSRTEVAQRIVYRKPDTIIEQMDFLICGKSLIVLGDYGEAIYQWSSNVYFDSFSTMNLDYFHGKCKASPESCVSHRRFTTWDAKLATEKLNGLQKYHSDVDLRLTPSILKECYAEIYEYEAWKVFLDGNFEYFSYFLDEPSYIYELGLVIHPWCQNHWKALQDIGALLKEEEKVNAADRTLYFGR
jgi:hypothetical protein